MFFREISRLLYAIGKVLNVKNVKQKQNKRSFPEINGTLPCVLWSVLSTHICLFTFDHSDLPAPSRKVERVHLRGEDHAFKMTTAIK